MSPGRKRLITPTPFSPCLGFMNRALEREPPRPPSRCRRPTALRISCERERSAATRITYVVSYQCQPHEATPSIKTRLQLHARVRRRSPTGLMSSAVAAGVASSLPSLPGRSTAPPLGLAEKNSEMVFGLFKAFTLSRREPVPSPVDIERQHGHRRAEGLGLPSNAALS